MSDKDEVLLDQLIQVSRDSSSPLHQLHLRRYGHRLLSDDARQHTSIRFSFIRETALVFLGDKHRTSKVSRETPRSPV